MSQIDVLVESLKRAGLSDREIEERIYKLKRTGMTDEEVVESVNKSFDIPEGTPVR